MQYNNPTPVSVIIIPVQKDNEIGYLGIQRNVEPFIGGLAFPGGFVDENEGLRQAAARELYEEVGFKIEDIKTLLFIHEETIKEKNQLIVFFNYGKVVPWEDIETAYNLNKNKEVQNIVFLDKNSTLCFPLHNAVLHKFFKDYDTLVDYLNHF